MPAPAATPTSKKLKMCPHAKDATTCVTCLGVGKKSKEPERKKICGYYIHPAADLLPEATPEEYARLKADIKEHGQQVPIILARGLSGEDEILDGRTRARILEELHPEEDDWETYGFTTEYTDDPVALALSLNLERRHLRPDQVVAVLVLAEAVRANVGPKRSPKGTNRIKNLAKTSGASRSTVKSVLAVQKADPDKVTEIVKGLTSANKVLRDRQAEHKAAVRKEERERAARSAEWEKEEAAAAAAFKKKAKCTECDCKHGHDGCECRPWSHHEYSTAPPICVDCGHEHQRRNPCMTKDCECLADRRGEGDKKTYLSHQDRPGDAALPKVRRNEIHEAAKSIREDGAELPDLNWFAQRDLLTKYPEVKPAFDLFFEVAGKAFSDLADAVEKLAP
jgi:hypothetical protein